MTHTSHTPRPSAWGSVFAMALAAFALVSSEFMPVSLLTPISGELRISEGQAGQAIALSGVFAMFTSLVTARLAGRIDRKRLLAALTFLMIISGGVVAFAPTATVFMVGRALLGMAIGGFWSLSAAVAIRLVSHDDVPKALAVINGGNALASVLAAPLGSFLGGLVGWRWAFFSVVPVAIAALAWQWMRLPSLPAQPNARPANPLRLLGESRITWGAIAVALFFMGQFALFTYLRPYLEQTLHAGSSTLSVLLLILGVSGFVGTTVIGRFLHRGIFRPLLMISLVMTLIAVSLMATSLPLVVVGILLGLWGFLGTAAPVGWWTWIARAVPDDAEAGGGLMVAVVQLSITLGASVGGILFDAHGYRATFEAAAVLLLVSAVLTQVAARQRHASPAQAVGEA